MNLEFPERKFFPLPLAAERLKCTVQDLIHFAATSQITISVYLDTGWDKFVLHSTVSNGEWHFEEGERPSVEYSGLADIPGGYIKDSELPGKMVSSNLFCVPDGRNILHAPYLIDEGSEAFAGSAKTVFSADELLITAAELRRLEALHKASQEKPLTAVLDELTSKSRRTLHYLIAALCLEAKINPGERGAAATLAAVTQRAGLPVGDDTIRKVLAELPEVKPDR